MFQYAQTLLDRNRIEEGVSVVHRILELDPGYGPALEALAKLKRQPRIRATYPGECVCPDQLGIVHPSNEELKREILSEEAAIKTLSQDTTHLHPNG